MQEKCISVHLVKITGFAWGVRVSLEEYENNGQKRYSFCVFKERLCEQMLWDLEN